jgi:uncharacterized protein
MPDRDGYIPGVPCWVDTTQPDPQAAARFYSGLFGWEIEDVMPPGASGSYLIGRLRGGDVAAISGQADPAPSQAEWDTYIWVDSADETAAKVWAAGGRVLMEPFDVPGAGRMAVFLDKEGAAFRVWQPGDHRGANVVNEHGSLVFNELHTRNERAAAAFYGAVFGWEQMGGPEGGGMWRLPGYGDHLEASEPALRQRMAEAGAPPGFEDVVASYVPIPADAPESTPHWTVTFSVEDTDAAAARAVELGGSVLVAPFDAPWVRTAVIADPAGGTFNVTKFVPENRDLASPVEAAARAA